MQVRLKRGIFSFFFSWPETVGECNFPFLLVQWCAHGICQVSPAVKNLLLVIARKKKKM